MPAEPTFAFVPAAADHEDRTGFAHRILAYFVEMLNSAFAAVLQGSAVAGQTSPITFIQQMRFFFCLVSSFYRWV